MKAAELLRAIGDLSASANRDNIVLAAVNAGGLRQWAWVKIPVFDAAGAQVGSFRAQIDYVAIGDENDWVRVPVGGSVAQEIADCAGAVLPCAYMVHLIWRAAPLKLRPITFPTAGMTSTKRFVEHHERIEKQRDGRAGLIAGIKKDTIVTNKLLKKPNATAIFGWHHPNGQIIQPVSTAHDQPWYCDYSHGVRLVHPEMEIGGERVLVQTVLRDAVRSQLLTGGNSWLAKVGGPGDEVLQVVRYGAKVVASVPTNYTPANDTTPPALSDLGERALRWCIAEMNAGVQEEPLGSNKGPRIAQYFAQARRRETGKLLGITSGDWCAVAQSAALSSAANFGQHVPHGYRAAVWELREDGKVTGAWVPAEDIRTGKYKPVAGDLVLWKRGPGLGHVSRIEVAPNEAGNMTTIGANEGDGRWTRRTRSTKDSSFEGVIRYSGFRPVMTLEQKGDLAVPSSSDDALAPGQNDDSWAQRIFLTAWAREFAVPPTPQERQTILAIARHERLYGLAKKPLSGIGANNWGGVQCNTKGPCGDDCYPGGDRNLKGESYQACFKKYATPADGAQHLIQLVTKRRPHVHDQMKRGNLLGVAQEMGTPRSINGKLYRPYHETPVDQYFAALMANAKIIAKNLGEPLAVHGENEPLTTTPSVTVRPELIQIQHTTKAPRSKTQEGVRALIRSRAPGLERIVVGAELSDVLRTDIAETLGLLPAETTPGVETGVSTTLDVKDYATRVNNYIRALAEIITTERKTRDNDTFPWAEWATFYATWDETYFQIMHSFVPFFDDSVVRTYDALSRQWAEIVKGHYGRSPAQPQLAPPQPIAAKAIAAVTAIAGAGILAYVLTSRR